MPEFLCQSMLPQSNKNHIQQTQWKKVKVVYLYQGVNKKQ